MTPKLRSFVSSFILTACLLWSTAYNHTASWKTTLFLLAAWWSFAFLGDFLPRSKTFRILRAIFFGAILLSQLGLPLKNRMVEKNQENYEHVHDGVLDTEYALDLLSHGRNIYSEDVPAIVFGLDSKAYLTFYDSHWEKTRILNPAIFHYIYPPFFNLQSFPFYWALNKAFHWYDQRVVLIFYLILFLCLIGRLKIDDDTRYTALALLSLNPYFVFFFLEGRNDFLVFFWLFLMFYFLFQKRSRAAIFSLAIACLTKQAAWIFVPFVYLYLHRVWQPISLKKYVQRAFGESWVPLLFSAAVTVPFLVWDFNGLWTDLILYPSGKLPTSYPINGYSLLAFLFQWGFLKSRFNYYPIVLVQLPVYFAVLGWSYSRFQKSATVAALVLQTTIALFCFWFFSRFYHDNYVEFTFRMLVLAWLFLKMEDARKGVQNEG
jgi:hypothetical protein